MSAAKPEATATDTAQPYAMTQVKTIEIAGPIKITWTTKTDSTHVPPAPPVPCDSDDDGGRFMEALRPLAEALLQKLEEIRQNQNPS